MTVKQVQVLTYFLILEVLVWFIHWCASYTAVVQHRTVLCYKRAPCTELEKSKDYRRVSLSETTVVLKSVDGTFTTMNTFLSSQKRLHLCIS